MTKTGGERKDEDSFSFDGEGSFVREERDSKPVYDLEERTARFGEAIIEFARKIQRDPVTDRIITQFSRRWDKRGWKLHRS